MKSAVGKVSGNLAASEVRVCPSDLRAMARGVGRYGAMFKPLALVCSTIFYKGQALGAY